MGTTFSFSNPTRLEVTSQAIVLLLLPRAQLLQYMGKARALSEASDINPVLKDSFRVSCFQVGIPILPT